jgi:DNA mismatch endonuclease (patch repair protein)
MADIVSASVRSRMMGGIKGKNTKPEIVVRSYLFAAGYRFRLHRRDLPGAPDIVMPGRRVAVFVHGCFWHRHAGCRYAKLPSTRPEFWRGKLEDNSERDARASDALLAQGWRVLVVWECAVRDERKQGGLQERLVSWINGKEVEGTFSGATR